MKNAKLLLNKIYQKIYYYQKFLTLSPWETSLGQCFYYSKHVKVIWTTEKLVLGNFWSLRIEGSKSSFYLPGHFAFSPIIFSIDHFHIYDIPVGHLQSVELKLSKESGEERFVDDWKVDWVWHIFMMKGTNFHLCQTFWS